MVNDHVPIFYCHGGYPIFRPPPPAASGPGPISIAEDHPPRKIEADLLTQPLCVQDGLPLKNPFWLAGYPLGPDTRDILVLDGESHRD